MLLLELLVLEAVLLVCALVIPAALPATSDCALCVSWERSADMEESLLEEELLLEDDAAADVPLCNALTRSPALASNCCRLIELLPFDICENRAFAACVWLVPLLPAAAEVWAKKLLNSLWLTLPSPFVSMEANSSSSVCARLDELPVLPVLLLPLDPLVANSEL